jgi:uncharacterized protein YbcI
MLEQMFRDIEKTYIECEIEILGTQPKEIEVRVIRNHIVILVKGSPTIEESIAPSWIRGHNMQKAIYDIEREQFQTLLKQKFTDLIGCTVTSVQTDICMDTGGKMEMVHFDCDLESKYIHD